MDHVLWSFARMKCVNDMYTGITNNKKRFPDVLKNKFKQSLANPRIHILTYIHMCMYALLQLDLIQKKIRNFIPAVFGIMNLHGQLHD